MPISQFCCCLLQSLHLRDLLAPTTHAQKEPGSGSASGKGGRSGTGGSDSGEKPERKPFLLGKDKDIVIDSETSEINIR
jgi:hypothetical protein